MAYTIHTTKNVQADLATAERALQELARMFASNADIHTFTRPIGVITRNFFLPFDQRYQVTTATHADFEKTVQEIIALTKVGDERNKVTIVLNSIRTMRGKLDAETGLDVMNLLVKTWELAKKIPFANAQSLVIDNLRHNKDTGGGCYPGIAARLVQPYTIFLKEAVRHQNQLSVTHHDVDNDNDDDDLALAKVLSLSQNSYIPNYNRVAATPTPKTTNREQNDLDQALALSLAETAVVNNHNNNRPMNNDHYQNNNHNNNNQYNNYQNSLNGGISDEDLALALVLEQSLQLK